MTVEEIIRAEAAARGVPPDLALALARRESSLNPYARGAAGEVGLFQLMPATAAELGVDPYNVQQNIAGGLSYLRQQYDRFGSWDLALAAYNAGPSRVASGSIPSSTRSYVASILAAVGLAQPEYTFEAWAGSGFPAGQPVEESTPGGTSPYLLIALAALALVVVSR